MNKSVLISIQPKWCELIASGKKTVEVRKTKPKLEIPFKVYIYCTYGTALVEHRDKFIPDKLLERTNVSKKKIWGNCCNGRVIGEFVCDKIEEIRQREVFNADVFRSTTCMTINEFLDYIDDKTAYLWHISDLVIYDWPRALCLFNHPHYKDCDIECGNCKYGFPTAELSFEDYICDRVLQRAPQSWCYVEEVK